MKRRFTRPREHPRTTPKTFPAVEANRVALASCCVSVSCGIVRPSRSAASSIVDPNRTPLVSLKIWPIAAAARDERPNATPTDRSMASPA